MNKSALLLQKALLKLGNDWVDCGSNGMASRRFNGLRMRCVMNDLVVVQSSESSFNSLSVNDALDQEIIQQIVKIENNSDIRINRLLIYFKNGYQLSVIQGFCTYGSESGLFEIAIIDPAGEMSASLWDDEDDNDSSVCRHCSVEKVKHYMKKVSQLVCETPVVLTMSMKSIVVD